jgi:outer membrane protein OmpA-like peptidoglycan-associated protein
MRLLVALMFLIILSGCVSKTVFDEMVESRDYYKEEYLAADSFRIVNNNLIERNRNLETELNKAEFELNKSISTNQALYRNYDELLAEYNRVLIRTNDVVAVTAYEKQNLTERLSVQQAELDRVKRSNTSINPVNTQNSGVSPAPYETTGDPSVFSAVQLQWKRQQEIMTEMQQRLSQAVVGYGASAKVHSKSNRITLSLSHSVLFTEGGYQLGADGFEILKTVGFIIKSYNNLEIFVLGRGDSYGASDTNLEYGIQRASAVALFLSTCGVNPESIYASGQSISASGAFGVQPVMDLTDIIITPKMDTIYQLLDR